MHQHTQAVGPLLDNALARGPYALIGAAPAGLLYLVDTCLRGYESVRGMQSEGSRLNVQVNKHLAFGLRGHSAFRKQRQLREAS